MTESADTHDHIADTSGQAGDHHANDPQGPTRNYVPGDICIVIETSQPDQIRALYSQVIDDLNDRFKDSAFRLATHDLFSQQRYLGDDPRQFVQEDREQRSPVQPVDTLTPWVVFTPAGADADALLFYRVTAASDGRRRPGMEFDAFTTINAAITERVLRPQNRPYAVRGCDLNWFHPAADDHSQGCPATRPEPAPTPPASGHFTNIPAALQPAAAGAQVTVVVLDTCPEYSVVTTAPARFPLNMLLARVVSGVAGPNPVTPVNFTSANSLSRILATYVGGSPPLPSMEAWHLEAPPVAADFPDFRMDDHGLFVSGIIRDIAPYANIELIRVLGDYGVGHTTGITTVLQALSQRLIDNPNQRLIVNLSLVASLLPTQMTLTGVYEAMRVAIRNLVNRDALVIASAGNEDEGTPAPTHPAPTMFPARMPEVLSVSAINRSNQKAWFADRASLPAQDNGVAVFGGDLATPSGGTHEPFINMQPGAGQPIDAVVGIFSAPGTLPLNVHTNPTMPTPPSPPPDRTNKTGWVYWSGSSFATPVISGMAANVWQKDGSLTAGEVRKKIMDEAEAMDPDAAFRAYAGAHRILNVRQA
jgi:hypothetical protein